MSLTAIGERAAISAIRFAPKQLYSTLVDWGARRRIPRGLRRPIYATYSRLVGADLSEVELPLSDYESLGDFFARRLQPGARDASTDMTRAASPCDGRIGSMGDLEGEQLLQAKGRTYSLRALLADDELATRLDGGTQVTIYLSPADYHRVHAPLGGKFVGYTYVPGKRYPVGQFFAERVDSLFADNERLVLELETEDGPVALVLVGAMGVGNLCLAKPRIASREFGGQRVVRRVRFDEPIPLARGDEMGAFRLGSTVVMVMGAGVFSTEDLDVGERVECGQPLGRLIRSTAWMVQ